MASIVDALLTATRGLLFVVANDETESHIILALNICCFYKLLEMWNSNTDSTIFIILLDKADVKRLGFYIVFLMLYQLR